MKTNKAIAKRFQIKGKGKKKKLMKRTDGQDHFNARESGKTKRAKRTDSALQNKALGKTIFRAMPYNA
jgi:ribosomal protein L35